MAVSTADLYDAHGERLQVLELPLLDLGARAAFSGRIRTVKAYEDNSKVKATLAEPGEGGVLVVDGAGSRRFALLGDAIAASAVQQGWAGVVIFGCVRDAAVLAGMPVGIRALGTTPRKTVKRGEGLVDVPVAFGGVRFHPGAWLYADRDGVVVADEALPAPS